MQKKGFNSFGSELFSKYSIIYCYIKVETGYDDIKLELNPISWGCSASAMTTGPYISKTLQFRTLVKFSTIYKSRVSVSSSNLPQNDESEQICQRLPLLRVRLKIPGTGTDSLFDFFSVTGKKPVSNTFVETIKKKFEIMKTAPTDVRHLFIFCSSDVFLSKKIIAPLFWRLDIGLLKSGCPFDAEHLSQKNWFG